MRYAMKGHPRYHQGRGYRALRRLRAAPRRILLSTARLNRILEIDTDNLMAVVEAE